MRNFIKFLKNEKNADILKYIIMITTVVTMLILTECGAFAAEGSEFFGGDTSTFINKSVLTIKIVRFIAIFIVIAGIVWAGAEFTVRNDQQKGAHILVSAVIGGFAVLLAPTLINFVIGGLGITDITKIEGN
jgi:uncharacterized BrkB/YihY/UPF0761 family membrane protein